MPNIELNGATTEVSATTLEALLNEQGFSGAVATALNEAFVPQSLRATTPLNDGDRVEVLAPMQGG